MKFYKNAISWLQEKKILKDSLIIIGWSFALIIFAGIFWYFTQPIRNRILVNTVNQVIEQSGDNRRILEPIMMRNIRDKGLGRWYYSTDNTKIYIFIFIGKGTFFPCAAITTTDGSIEKYIPLNRYGERIFSDISPEIINIYSRRVEGRS